MSIVEVMLTASRAAPNRNFPQRLRHDYGLSRPAIITDRAGLSTFCGDLRSFLQRRTDGDSTVCTYREA